LIRNWDDLHANSKRMVFNVFPNIATELNRPDTVNLVLVVDNLAWSFGEALIEMFQEEGYFQTQVLPYLAMLPTETETSKKCLLSGEVGYTEIDDRSYKGIIEKGWLPYFNEQTFQYVSGIGKLKEIKQIEATTYVVNYLAVDRALHKSEDEIGISHRKHIQHLLKELVGLVIDFIENHHLKSSIRIHVVSDHGSTQIPSNFQNDLEPANFKSSGFKSRSHRYLEVSDERFTTLADNLSFDAFLLDKNRFLLPKHILASRRANRFLKTDHKSYVHGGLLPEEVIVPYLAFEPVTVPLQDLTVLMAKNIFRYRLETVEIEIGNPNEFLVENIQVSILNGNVESDPVMIPSLNGKSKTLVSVETRFKITSLPDDQKNLRLRLRYHSRGERHMLDISSGITMKKMVEEKSTSVFDDLE